MAWRRTAPLGGKGPRGTGAATSGAQDDSVEVQYIGNNTFMVIEYVGSVAASGDFVAEGGLTWMPVSSMQINWAAASAYCTGTTIGGLPGWRQPTEAELLAMNASGAMNNHGWSLYFTWSGDTVNSGQDAYAVVLPQGYNGAIATSNIAYVSCVR